MEDSNRLYVITPTDRSGLVVIVAALFLSWMVLSFLIRLYTRFAITGPFAVDDLVSGFGTIFGIVQVGAIFGAVSHGFGKSITLLKPSQVVEIEKATYVADILFLLGHGTAKASVILLLRRLHREKIYQRICDGILGTTGIWVLGSVLAIALECNLSHPWLQEGQCRGVLLRWQIITAIDVTSEATMFLMSIYLVWGLQMRPSGKVVVIGAFAFRLPWVLLQPGIYQLRLAGWPLIWIRSLIIIATLRITYLKVGLMSSDPTLAFVDANLCMEVLLHYSLMAATIPCLKPFVISFNTGWGLGVANKRAGYVKQSVSYGSRSTAPSAPPDPVMLAPFWHGPPGSRTHVTNIEAGDRCTDLTDSIHSHESQRMIIRETRAWTVEHESIIEMTPLGSNRG